MQENFDSMSFGKSARKYCLSVQSIGSKEPLNFGPKLYAASQCAVYQLVDGD